jgi:hypothetical protein
MTTDYERGLADAAKAAESFYDSKRKIVDSGAMLIAHIVKKIHTLAPARGVEARKPRCDCCGHPPHDDRPTCDHPEPLWHEGRCHCAGSTKKGKVVK